MTVVAFESPNPHPRMSELAERFPTLRGVPGVRPFDCMKLLRWLCTSGGVTAGSLNAAKFILQVFNPRQDWDDLARRNGILDDEDEPLRPFNLAEAVSRWDQAHIDACQSWIEKPFLP